MHIWLVGPGQAELKQLMDAAGAFLWMVMHIIHYDVDGQLSRIKATYLFFSCPPSILAFAWFLLFFLSCPSK